MKNDVRNKIYNVSQFGGGERGCEQFQKEVEPSVGEASPAPPLIDELYCWHFSV